jgi:hypothetical protein
MSIPILSKDKMYLPKGKTFIGDDADLATYVDGEDKNQDAAIAALVAEDIVLAGDISAIEAEGTIIAANTNQLNLSITGTAAVTTSATLATIFTITLPADTVRISLVPRGTIYWNIGTAPATTDTALIPLAGIDFPVNKTVGDTIKLYAASSTVCDISVYVPRA